MKKERILEFLEKGYSCVIYKDNDVLYTSKNSAIKPLLEFINLNIDASGSSAIDKVIGKAAAMLYKYIGITYIYTKVISQNAYDYLKNENIEVEYETLVERIIPRPGLKCSLELMIKDAKDEKEAYLILSNYFKELN